LKRIGFGRTAEFYEISNERVVKLFYSDFSNEMAQTEYSINNRIAKMLPSIPKVYELVKIEGRNGIVFERIEGDTLSHYLARNPLKVLRTANRFASLHREVNDVVLQNIGSDDQKDKIKRSKILTESEKEVLINFLDKTNSNNLCHGDYHPENVMVAGDDSMRIIDWMTAFAGNPLLDIARTYYLLRYGRSPEKKPLITQGLESILKLVFSKRYLKQRLIRQADKKLFPYFYFIIQVTRLEDNILIENVKLEKKIMRKKGKLIERIRRYNLTH
jgi:thiamine kinase-like enzyme